MVIEFSKLDLNEPQILVLKNLDGTFLQPLTFATELKGAFNYNEVSEIEFKLPKYVNGAFTPGYDMVVGMRIVDWLNIGQFILVNPTEESNGVLEFKSCKAYSLEHELTYKTIYMEEGTWNLWNPVAPEDTVLGRILEVVPTWRIGSVDADLIGRYRTFEADNQNVYEFMKGTLQETYQCVFDFDTYNRVINVKSVHSIVDQKPVYLSLRNLIKDIKVEEDTENIYTVLDVNGADGVDIRSVNPMGTNKIYNLDYFMNTTYFSQDMIDKWNNWKKIYEDAQRPYFNLTVEKVLKEAQLIAEKAALTELKGELSQLETLQSTYVEFAGQGYDRSEDLASVKSDIADKQAEISEKESLIQSIESEIESKQAEQIEINNQCSFDNPELGFTREEFEVLSRYFKESAITEDSFVYNEISSYTNTAISKNVENSNVEISNAVVTENMTDSGKDIYCIIGGNVVIEVTGYHITANVVRGAFEVDSNGKGLFTAYLNAGSYDNTAFQSGCISLTCNDVNISSDIVESDDIKDYEEGTRLHIAANESNLYFTLDETEYAKRSVEWDLFEFGQQSLEDLCWPTYTFSIDSANFIAMKEFEVFKNQFDLGSRVYLDFGEKVLTPIVIGVELEADKPSSFKLTFGDNYSAKDSAFKMVDLLKESINMGKNTASNRFNYNQFVESGANTAVKDFMESALDAAKNAVLAGVNQSVTIDGNGIRLRQWNTDKQAYDDEQIWMINNNIVFTDDGWDTAKMALGHIVNTDENIDAWGLVGDLLVGKVLAGENLVIESKQQDGTTIAFRVDASGAQMHNGRFDLLSGAGQITLYPETGLVGGVSTVGAPLFSYDENGVLKGIMTTNGETLVSLDNLSSDDLPNANFWIDMNGNAYFKGTVYAEDGEFTGTVYATGGEFKGTVNAQNLQLDGVNISNVFAAVGTGETDESGIEDLDYLRIGDIIIDGQTGAITFGGETNVVQVRYATSKDGPWQEEWDSSWTNVEVWAQYSYNGGTTWTTAMLVQGKSGEDGQDGSDANRVAYIKSTYIDFSQVASPTIIANEVQTLGTFQVGTGSRTSFEACGFMGTATGMDSSGTTTYGVALSAEGDPVDYWTNGHYAIVTNAGVRLQSAGNWILVTDNGIYLNTEDGNGEAYYNGVEIGTGAGGVAVFG